MFWFYENDHLLRKAFGSFLNSIRKIKIRKYQQNEISLKLKAAVLDKHAPKIFENSELRTRTKLPQDAKKLGPCMTLVVVF